MTVVEQLLLYRLAIFTGNFDLDAAEAICAFDPLYKEEIIELLTHLAEKSLVVIVEEKGGKRKYRLLELIKDFGKEKIEEPEAMRLKENHHSYYLDKADTQVG